MLKQLFYISSFLSIVFALNFTDIPNNHWSNSYINELVEVGAITPGGLYMGDKPISRYEVAVIISKYNRYIQQKLNNSVKKSENLETLSAAQSEEYGEELVVIKNDIKYLEARLNRATFKSPLKLMIESRTLLSSSSSDKFSMNAKFSYFQVFDDLNINFSVSTIEQNNGTNTSLIETNVAGANSFPFLNEIRYEINHGPRDQVNKYGEVCSYMGDRIMLASSLIPFELALDFVTSNQNVFSYKISNSITVSDYNIGFGWQKKYLYNNNVSSMLKANGIKDNKDLLYLNLKINSFTLQNQLTFSGQNNYSYLFKAKFPFLFDGAGYIKLLTLDSYGYNYSLGDSYETIGALDIFSAPLDNNSSSQEVGAENIFNILYVAVQRIIIGENTYLKAKTGLIIKVSDKVSIKPEGRVAVNPDNSELMVVLNFILNL